ncbi:ImmA/IrrE family metallo-endopeptidase [Fluviispira multicolorata]|uniref:Uncharacterized protein n=1 Tax=Fluviispira multicolorata TaxID=2654512 RepID=A0A833JEL5_9BACT|nr:hypothetical protein [Fluviispira multicolorata]KAB8029949.1 hypothetical protein GCL57_10460 [Fluviispira multicolorata]
MINVENNRFPHSAELFRFCKEVLTLRKSTPEKVTDQDVGALLGFDPADCTHWKYGRKNIKSIQNINQLANALEVDPRNLIDISLGKNVLYDALFEYQGYGEFLNSADERNTLMQEANRIIELANIKAVPVLLPELSQVLPDVELKAQEDQKEIVQSRYENGKCLISWQKGERFGTALRFLLAREFALVLLSSETLKSELPQGKNTNFANTLALFLLMPSHLLQIACSQCDPARDTVEQLMDLFWLSRTLVNIRLKDFLIYRN